MWFQRRLLDAASVRLRYYRSLGIRFPLTMTDKGSCHRSCKFWCLLRRLGLRHLRTKPYMQGLTARSSASSRRGLRYVSVRTVAPGSGARLNKVIRHGSTCHLLYIDSTREFGIGYAFRKSGEKHKAGMDRRFESLGSQRDCTGLPKDVSGSHEKTTESPHALIGTPSPN